MPRFRFDHPVLHTPAIWHPDAPRDDYAIVLFRRRFTLDEPPDGITLWISASQRFELFVDGRRVARGPSRSDPQQWHVMPVGLPALKSGERVLAVRVVNFAGSAGVGQLGGPAFFLLQGRVGDGTDLSSSPEWRCLHDQSIAPIKRHHWGGKYPNYAVGAGDCVQAGETPWGWTDVDFDDRDWPKATIVCKAAANPWGNLPLGHWLRPDPLPQMEETPQRFARVADAPDDLREQAEAAIAGRGNLQIPANRTVRLAIDQSYLTNAYPLLTVSGGAGAAIRMIGAEAPYPDADEPKGNRDCIEGKHLWGHHDEFHLDGGDRRAFSTLWFRSFRYIELTITTRDEPLTVHGVQSTFTGYPLDQHASFEPEAQAAERFQTLWDVSWRTIRLCAHETFFDCPHYEQAQFPGDSRVQAIYHFLVANDDGLARKAIDDFMPSRMADGMIQCSYPCTRLQVLPTFGLYWIAMMHDLLVYRGHVDFLRSYMPAARAIVDWFEQRRRDDGMLGLIEHAPFIDWSPGFPFGNAPQDENGGSSILSLLFASACGWMADLETTCGYPELAERWRTLRQSLVDAAMTHCWDEARGMLANTSSKQSWSLHAQVEATLAGGLEPASALAAITNAATADDAAQPGSFYYRYYHVQALKRIGHRDGLFDLLPRWDRCLDGSGLTTWPETEKPTPRSDCHAWSVTPAIEMLRTILGVEPDPAQPGFARAFLRPTLGPLREARGVVPTPRGDIRIKLERQADHIAAEIDTPIPLITEASGNPLPPGKHNLALPDA